MNLDELRKADLKSDAHANYNTLRCIAITFLVYFFSWVLNVLHIFIVDSDIMNRGLVGMFIFIVIIYGTCKILGYNAPATKYIVMFFSVAMWSFLIMTLTYHVLLIILFPLICSLQYHEKKMMIYAYILTLIGIAVATELGFLFGLCDANMLLLTAGTTEYHAQILQLGEYTFNKNLFTIFLFFVFPRWMIITAFVPMFSTLVKDIEDRVVREIAARRHAAMDDMTGVFNKNKYLAMLKEYYPTVDWVCVIFWDVNHLKQINDRFGHEAGDQLIIALSDSILQYQDENKKIYRIGGDEFVLVGENLPVGTAEAIIADWKQKITGRIIRNDIMVSSAVGFAEGKGQDIEQVIKQADENMYQNKKAANNLL